MNYTFANKGDIQKIVYLNYFPYATITPDNNECDYRNVGRQNYSSSVSLVNSLIKFNI